MAVEILSNPMFTWSPQGVDPTGMKLFTYAAGTTIKQRTWTSTAKTANHTNPIVLNSKGQPNNGSPIVIDGSYKFVIAPADDTDPPSSGIVIADNYSSEAVSSVTGNFNLVTNGSFEDDSNSDGTPDGWVIAELTGGSITTDTTDVAHGAKSLLFTSTTAGGGAATSESFFPVLAGSTLNGIVSVKSSSATNHNTVEVYWYNKSSTYLSKTSIYDKAAGNPTTWTQYNTAVTAPATATQAKIVCTGVAADSTTLASSCRFDDVKLQEISGVEASGLTGLTSTIAELNYADDPNTANKFCLLDGSADVPLAQIPNTLTGKDADSVDGYDFGILTQGPVSSVVAGASAGASAGHANVTVIGVYAGSPATTGVVGYDVPGRLCAWTETYLNSTTVYYKNNTAGTLNGVYIKSTYFDLA